VKYHVIVRFVNPGIHPSKDVVMQANGFWGFRSKWEMARRVLGNAPWELLGIVWLHQWVDRVKPLKWDS